MRNLKKFLALVLALMMVVSVMVTVNAFNDSEDVSAKYEDAVTILGGLNVLQGDPSGNLRPQEPISRSEMATIAYRITTGDTKAQSPVVKNSHFSDVADNHWAAGFINWCADGQLLAGYPDGTYKPDDEVTGYDALTIVLRALGYGKAGELTGNGYETNAATLGQRLGMLTNVALTDLAKPATREMVAELAYQACEQDVVRYSVGLNYWSAGVSLMKTAFGGDVIPSVEYDELARPYNVWTLNGKVIASAEIAPEAAWTTAVTQCDVAKALGWSSKTNTIRIFRNGINNEIPNQPVDATNTTTNKIGAQGELTALYWVASKPYIVQIDTYLAKVDDVVDATFDPAGHMKSDSALSMTIYCGSAAGDTRKMFVTGNGVDFTYAKGDYILVNYVANNANSDIVKGTSAGNGKGYFQPAYLEIVREADSFNAPLVSWTNPSLDRNVGGSTYHAAAKFFLDDNNKQVDGIDYTWYRDQYGNLIGSTEIVVPDDPHSYGTITDIQWINPVGASGYAQAHVVYMDGTKSTEALKVSEFVGQPLTYSTSGTTPGNPDSQGRYVVSTNIDENVAYVGNHLWKFTETTNGLKIEATNFNAGTTAVTTGNPVMPGTTKLSVDSTTMFLVRSGAYATGYTYTPYVGYNNVPSMNAPARVDYVDEDGNGVADYVYIIAGTGVAATAKELVYVGDKAQYVVDNDKINYILKDAYVAGVLTDVKVGSSNYASLFTANNSVYLVTYTNGVVTAATKIDGNDDYTLSDGSIARVFTVTSYENDVVELSNHVRCNTTLVNVYGGDVKVGANVVLVFTKVNTNTGVVHYVSDIYVL